MKNILDVACSLDCFRSELLSLLDAMHLFDENFEDEAYQPSDKIEEWKAINFVQRSDLYLSTFRVIWRDLKRITDEMGAEVDSMYENHRKGCST